MLWIRRNWNSGGHFCLSALGILEISTHRSRKSCSSFVNSSSFSTTQNFPAILETFEPDASSTVPGKIPPSKPQTVMAQPNDPFTAEPDNTPLQDPFATPLTVNDLEDEAGNPDEWEYEYSTTETEVGAPQLICPGNRS